MGLNRINIISTELGKTETYAGILIFKFTVNIIPQHTAKIVLCITFTKFVDAYKIILCFSRLLRVHRAIQEVWCFNTDVTLVICRQTDYCLLVGKVQITVNTTKLLFS